ncbi:hypothetical protein N9L33_04420 [Nitrospinae bacterium]|nr:hypothetical protein [Nitrospinota bacterium]
MESIDKLKLKGILDFLEKGYTYELVKADSTWGAQMMQTFQGMNLILRISQFMRFGEEGIAKLA